jgi:hypothetical protein
MHRRYPFHPFTRYHRHRPAMSLTELQAAALAAEVAKCDRLLAKLWADDARQTVMMRRRSLLRLLHDVPLAVQLPIDWQPPAHPQVANLPPEFQ